MRVDARHGSRLTRLTPLARPRWGISVGAVFVCAACGCSRGSKASSTTATTSATDPGCMLVEQGYGPAGQANVRVETVATGLEVPWSMAFLPNGDALVTERVGRVRLLRAGALAAQPVVEVPVGRLGEGGLLGLALHPRFAETRTFYVYFTASSPTGAAGQNRVVRYVLDAAGTSARQDRVILDGIPSARFHDGGRLRFGPDGMLYVATGDARNPDLAQDPASLSGKLLRLTPDGDVPADNPVTGRPFYLLGIRNLEAFDWLDDGRLVLADHGPSGELGRTGHDEIDVARAGDNLGWPASWSCEAQVGTVLPLLVWAQAVPPGGGLLYRGDAVPAWKNSFLVGTLGSRHLHRVVLDAVGRGIVAHEVYFEGEPPTGFGRLRDVVAGPEGAVYVTTSNCDGRGTCPPERDKILRITTGR